MAQHLVGDGDRTPQPLDVGHLFLYMNRRYRSAMVRSSLSAFLLHIRTNVAIRHIEPEFDAFEQVYVPDENYALSREGYTANYAVVPDRPPAELLDFLSKHASAAFSLEQISLVEIGRSWEVVEQGCLSPAAEDGCGEWRRVWNDESFAYEEVRVRTGLDAWLHKHAQGASEVRRPASALLLYFHHPLRLGSRWLDRLRGALGNTCRANMRDDKSILLTWEGIEPHRLFRERRFHRYLDDGTVHTAFSFTIGLHQHHTLGDLLSVLPPSFQSTTSGRPLVRTPDLRIVERRSDGRDPEAVAAAIEKLKRQSRLRNS